MISRPSKALQDQDGLPHGWSILSGATMADDRSEFNDADVDSTLMQALPGISIVLDSNISRLH